MADLFENIQVGDKVLVEVVIRRDTYNSRSFIISRDVTHMTPKRFTTGKKQYRKSDGRLVGEGFAHAQPYKLENDQTAEAVKYKKFVEKEHKFKDAAYILYNSRIEQLDMLTDEEKDFIISTAEKLKRKG